MKFTPAFITSGSNVETDPTVWAALTNTGQFKISIDGTEQTINPDFSGVTTMSAVASAIQTAIRTATSGSETCEYNDFEKLVIKSGITTRSSSISHTSSPASGTDISGAGADDWLDMDSGNGIITNVGTSEGMDLEDIEKAVKLELFDDEDDTTMSDNWFIHTLNKGYRLALERIKKIYPAFFITNCTAFDITADNDNLQQIFTFEELGITNCLTVERVVYTPDGAAYNDDEYLIKMTVFDEKTNETHLRWYRAADKIIFRGVSDDVDNVKIYYSQRKPSLVADTDRPDFPDNDFDDILADYIIAMWYKKEATEVDYRPFLEDFYRRLQEMIDRTLPANEPFTPDVLMEDGIPSCY